MAMTGDSMSYNSNARDASIFGIKTKFGIWSFRACSNDPICAACWNHKIDPKSIPTEVIFSAARVGLR